MNDKPSATDFHLPPETAHDASTGSGSARDHQQEDRPDLESTDAYSASLTTDQLSSMSEADPRRRDAWMDTFRNQVRAHPMSTVAAAFLAGAMFHRLSRGRR